MHLNVDKRVAHASAAVGTLAVPTGAERAPSARPTRTLWLSLCTLCLTACHAPSAPPEHAAQAPDARHAQAAQASASATPAAPSPAPSPFTPEAEHAADEITEGFIREHIAKLSADTFEGRGPATPGDEATRHYLIEQLKALGLRPGAGDDQWEQPFDIVGIKSTLPKQWTFKRDKRTLDLRYWDQYIGTSGLQAERATVDKAEVVFVGYGIEAPEYHWDDFKGQDLKGKVLLMLNSDPDWDPELFAGDTRLYYGRWTYKYESAARHGAAGAIIIHTTPSAGYPFSVVQTSWSGEQFELPAEDEPRIALQAWVTESAARDLVKLAGQDLDALVQAARSRDFKPVPLGVTTSIDVKNELHRARTANVLGTLPGSDPALRSEYVIYTAHHDHLGIGKPNDRGDKIYNGALDNATGCAEVLSIAKAFTALAAAPRRSVMFLFVAAEEQGLLGSKYFAAHPTMPPGKIAANVNYDGGNIWGRTKDVTFIGKGKSSLDAQVEVVATRQGRVVKPDQFPDRGHFYRSDQFSFAHIGVPALYLDTGLDFIGRPADWGKLQIEQYEAKDYHQPSDELRAQWNFEGMLQDVKLGFWVGYLVANADKMPSWTPGDEFEAARKAALAQP